MTDKTFYWGASTASYQVEGGIENTDWAQAAREGRVPECGRAADHYSRYEEDFDIAKELGHNAHRFSIEWARIEPEEGKFDHEEIEHYRQVLQALHERGITPFITLWHFTLPLWFAEGGGFERKDAPEKFARYCQFVVSELSDLCEHFSTINEPNVYAALGWMKGMWPPFVRFGLVDKFKEVTISGDYDMAQPEVSLTSPFRYIKVAKNLAKSHNAAYKAIKENNSEVEVGLVKHTVAFGHRSGLINRLRAKTANLFWTSWFMKKVYKNCDHIGLNYYHYVEYGDKEEYKKTDMGWDMRPEHIYDALKILSRYNKPLYVTEAGLADHDDSDRAWYISEQVNGVLKAKEKGIDVRGHMYWSLLDNYEWAFGFEKRFGLVEIDYDTLERKIRPSAYVYKQIIEENSVVK